jgi:hypothetical protein
MPTPHSPNRTWPRVSHTRHVWANSNCRQHSKQQFITAVQTSDFLIQVVSAKGGWKRHNPENNVPRTSVGMTKPRTNVDLIKAPLLPTMSSKGKPEHHELSFQLYFSVIPGEYWNGTSQWRLTTPLFQPSSSAWTDFSFVYRVIPF